MKSPSQATGHSSDNQTPSIQSKEYLECQKLATEVQKIQAEIVSAGSRDKLQEDKLRAEIQDLTRSIWHRPQFYGAMTPVALAMIGLIFTWSSGWFDAQQKRLDAQRTKLEVEVNDLAKQKHWYETNIATLHVTNALLSKINNSLSNDIALLTKENIELKTVREKLQSAFSGAEESRAAVMAEVQQLQSERAILHSQGEILQSERNTYLRLAAKFLAEEPNPFGFPRQFTTNAVTDLDIIVFSHWPDSNYPQIRGKPFRSRLYRPLILFEFEYEQFLDSPPIKTSLKTDLKRTFDALQRVRHWKGMEKSMKQFGLVNTNE